ncbi:MAG: tetratricopeptide repeat protein [Rhodospirillales bacterium]|nr:tetratricopeptide repeat protein [Rhodospirillales bacterium]
MRIVRLAMLCIAFVLAGATAARAQDFEKQKAWCMDDAADADLRIGACTWLLNSGELAEGGAPFVFVHRAEARLKKGRFDLAARDLDQALRLNPKNAYGRTLLGDAHVGLGQHERAIQNYDESLRLEPSAHAYMRRGLAHQRAGRTARAIEDYDQALKLEPGESELHVHRGVAHMVLGNFEKAIQDLTRAIRLEPDYAMAHNSLAWIYATAKDARLRNGEEALRHARKALALERTPVSLDTLGAAFLARGEPAKAADAYKDSMELGGPGRVRRYQDDLRTRGFYSGPSDGVYGPAVERAIGECIRAGCIPLSN